MTDLVERLRNYREKEMSVPVEDLLLDAADEIERLREALRAVLNTRDV